MKIPSVLHRVWIGPDARRPPIYDQWWEQFADLNRGWLLRTWRDDTAEAICRQVGLGRAWDQVRKRGNAPAQPSMLTDLTRLAALWIEGGVVMDCDFQPVRPFRPYLDTVPDGTMLMAEVRHRPGQRRVIAAGMGAAAPKDAVVRWMIAEALRRAAEPGRFRALYVAGPELWGAALQQFPLRVVAAEQEVFFPGADAYDETRHGGYSRLPAGIEPTERTVAIHHGASLWVPQARGPDE